MKSPAPTSQDHHGHPAEDGAAPPHTGTPVPQLEHGANHVPPPRRTNWPTLNHHHVDAHEDDNLEDDRHDHLQHGDHNDGVDGDRDEAPIRDNHDAAPPRSSHPAPEPEHSDKHEPLPRRTNWPKVNHQHLEAHEDDNAKDDHHDRDRAPGSTTPSRPRPDEPDDQPSLADERMAQKEAQLSAFRKAKRTEMVQTAHRNSGSGGKVHGFHVDIARRVGVKAARVFEYYCYCARQNPAKTTKRSLKEIIKASPYLTRDEVRDARAKLEGGERPLLRKERRCAGKTTVYRPDLDAVTGKMHTFLVDVAAGLGVLPAVIYSYLHYHLWQRIQDIVDQRAEVLWERARRRRNAELDVDLESCSEAHRREELDKAADVDEINEAAFRYAENRGRFFLSPAQGQALWPYASLRSIERALNALHDSRLLRREQDGQRRVWWRLPSKIARVQLNNLKTFLSGNLEATQQPEGTVKQKSHQENARPLEPNVVPPPNSHTFRQIPTPLHLKYPRLLARNPLFRFRL